MKNRLIIRLFFCTMLALSFTQCSDERDSYYERPEWLEDPIFQVLEQEGRFGSYLQCVERTNYANILKGAGLSTVFAPNDDAFKAWLSKKSYASVADIPQKEAEDIVSYSIVYSSWTSEHLGDYFLEKKYVPGAFKRKTNKHALPYRDPEYNNEWVLDANADGGFSTGMGNYKYLPVYTEAFFNTFPVPLTADDYILFYPNATFTGRNVQDGTIVKADIMASNGVIHEVSTVNEPLKNIEDIIKDEPYSTLKSLLDMRNLTGEYSFKTYLSVPEILEQYKKMLPDETISQIFIKYYTSIAFSPALENIYSEATGSYDPEKTGYTLFAPTNQALQNYIDNRILKYYKSVQELPNEVISTLINTQCVTNLVWPSLYEGSVNYTGEFVNGEGNNGKKFDEAGVIDNIVASNGFVYRTNDVIKSRFFETVFSEIFLNPAHNLLNIAYNNFYATGLREDLMKSKLNGYVSERYTMLNFSDEMIENDGFTYNLLSNAFSNSLMSSGADERLRRLMRTHIFAGINNESVNSEVTDFTKGKIPDYNNYGFTINAYGDAVRFKDNQLQAAGNIEENTFVTITKVEEFLNGTVYNVDRLLQYTPRETGVDDARWIEKTLWQYLNTAKTENPNVSMFVDYVQTCLKNPLNDELSGIKPENFYTVLMPNNEAMQAAVDGGFIDALANVNTTDVEAMAKATKFVNAHFLTGQVLVDDGHNYLYPVNPMEPNRALVPTLLRITNEGLGLINERTLVEVTKTADGQLNFLPQDILLGSKVLVDASIGIPAPVRIQRGTVEGSALTDNFRSNRIVCKAVLHEIDNFMIYEEAEAETGTTTE